MSSSLFGAGNPANQQTNFETAASAVMGLIRGKNPQQLLQQLCAKDPQINNFVRHAQGKSPEQLCHELGVDYQMLRRLIK